MNRPENFLPKIAITMGDPAGIGPEINAKADWNKLFTDCIPIIFGNSSILKQAFQAFRPSFKIEHLENLNSNELKQGTLYLIDANEETQLDHLEKGLPSQLSGQASLDAIRAATDACIEKKVDAMVTAPVSKEAIEKTGIFFHGHTEWISKRCGSYDEMMMMSSEILNVGYVTTHVALRELPTIITEELVLKRLQTTWKFLVDSNIEQSIAVCGLNPHAGENGVLGNEENKHIVPAMEMARKEGIKCEGPYPADTLFIESKRKNYGAILAMYHDQGGIPFKMLSFDHGVNHTLGLPIIRTSVDHGTGWDIAWQGKASPKSLESAIKMAMTLAKAKSISNP